MSYDGDHFGNFAGGMKNQLLIFSGPHLITEQSLKDRVLKEEKTKRKQVTYFVWGKKLRFGTNTSLTRAKFPQCDGTHHKQNFKQIASP